ncbi:hypothetical protein [Pseudogulbenkiania ferrooxidans]|uniref:TspB protein n=1 Tax=Pseudogulbenkiania ferrooxidans 2002 TaxID=279714 RepID=B9Z8I4_9NEIS|nr:hypothetical protein [Pseudogulbenkiania ferrooxidans]EEG06922.1 hypothetical protein FuraDRAFT_3670 [Pseudogulbenkiania ferrooxidans 2002]
MKLKIAALVVCLTVLPVHATNLIFDSKGNIIGSYVAATPATQVDALRAKAALSGLVQQNAVQRGFSNTDPRVINTVSKVGTTAVGAAAGGAAAVVVAGVTAPAWVSVMAVAAVSTVVTYGVTVALDGVVKWAFGDNSTVTVSGSPGEMAFDQIPFASGAASNFKPAAMQKGGEAWCAMTTSATPICAGDPGTAIFGYLSSYVCAGTYQYPYRFDPSQCSAPYRDGDGSKTAWTKINVTGSTANIGYATAFLQYGSWTEFKGETFTYDVTKSVAAADCPVLSYSVGGKCTSLGITPTSTSSSADGVKSLSDAVSGLPDSEKSKPINPVLLAALANQLWKQAAQQPGYDGIPYSNIQPISAADAQAWQQANASYYPTVGDMTAPMPSAGSGATGGSSPWAPLPPDSTGTPVSPDTGTGTVTPGGSTGTNPGADQPQLNLGTDPGIGAPSLETTPTAQMILAPLLNLLPDFKRFTTPQHLAVCPKPEFNLFGKVIVMDSQCTIAEGQRQALYLIMTVVWGVVAVLIILSA